MKYNFFTAFILLLSSIILLPVSSVSATDNPHSKNKLITEIRDKSAALKSLSSNFTQTKKLSLFKQPIIFQGKLALTRPDKLRWEFTEPVASVLIFNGNSGLRCTEGQAPATFSLQSDPVMQMVAEQLWIWLAGDYTKLEKDYLVIQTAISTLRITPLAEHTATIIEAITLIFDETSYQPISVTIAEPAGDITVIDFTEHNLDPLLTEELFTQCYGRE